MISEAPNSNYNDLVIMFGKVALRIRQNKRRDILFDRKAADLNIAKVVESGIQYALACLALMCNNEQVVKKNLRVVR